MLRNEAFLFSNSMVYVKKSFCFLTGFIFLRENSLAAKFDYNYPGFIREILKAQEVPATITKSKLTIMGIFSSKCLVEPRSTSTVSLTRVKTKIIPRFSYKPRYLPSHPCSAPLFARCPSIPTSARKNRTTTTLLTLLEM